MRYLILPSMVFMVLTGCKTENNLTPENVFEGSLYLSTQEELDNFSQNQYTKVTGDLIIGELYQMTDEINSLDGLMTLKEVEGDLSIWSNVDLTNLSGLENIEFLGKNLNIWYNSNLKDYCAIKVLLLSNSISGEVRIHNNSQNPTTKEITINQCK